jgi:hypothetical protein
MMMHLSCSKQYDIAMQIVPASLLLSSLFKDALLLARVVKLVKCSFPCSRDSALINVNPTFSASASSHTHSDSVSASADPSSTPHHHTHPPLYAYDHAYAVFVPSSLPLCLHRPVSPSYYPARYRYRRRSRSQSLTRPTTRPLLALCGICSTLEAQLAT